jgi:hypothetical protein
VCLPVEAVGVVCASLLPVEAFLTVEYLATMLSVCVQWLSMPARPCSSEGIETRSPGESPVLHIYMVCLTYTPLNSGLDHSCLSGC